MNIKTTTRGISRFVGGFLALSLALTLAVGTAHAQNPSAKVTAKTANLVLLRANPLADIANTQTIEAVVVNGRLLDRSRLDQMLDRAKVERTPGQ